jgi:hypothetical protein
MALFLVSRHLHSHPSAHLAGDAIAFWAVAGSWCAGHSPEGFVPRHVVDMFGASAQSIDALTRSGLWHRARGGYQMVRALPAGRGGQPIELWKIERTDYRKKIPRHIRDAVYERDRQACVLCSATNDLTLDHIKPWSKGGPDTLGNLRTLCRPCNSSKGARI